MKMRVEMSIDIEDLERDRKSGMKLEKLRAI
jgi:hypothetical protein